MSAVATAVSPADRKKMLKMHEDAIAARKSADSPGAKMKARKALDMIELHLWRARIEFTPFEVEHAKPKRRYELSEEQLVLEITDLRAIVSDDSAPARIKSTAEQTVTRLIQQAERRGVEVPAQAS